MASVRKGKFHQCFLCDFKSERKDKVRSHYQRVHEKVRNYNCNQCDYKSYERNQLKKHVSSVHLKDKQFSCSYCDRSFAQMIEV